MSKVLATHGLRVVAALAILGGAANAAFATGNGGACAMHIHEVNVAFSGPVDGRGGGPAPVWQAFAGQCSGPCPPPAQCEPAATGTAQDGQGNTYNVVDCACVAKAPGGQIISIQLDEPAVVGTFLCKTAMLVSPGAGTFAGYACSTITCGSPCILKPDTHITQWDVEINGEPHMARSSSCSCP